METAETTLTKQETETLAYCEAGIAKCLLSFVPLGKAYYKIYSDKLYRMEYKSFEDYCRRRWEMQIRRVYQLMQSALFYERMKKLCTHTQLFFKNEGQIQPLMGLEDKQIMGVLRRIEHLVKYEKVHLTAKIVQSIVDELYPNTVKLPIPPSPPQKNDEKNVHKTNSITQYLKSKIRKLVSTCKVTIDYCFLQLNQLVELWEEAWQSPIDPYYCEIFSIEELRLIRAV